VRAAEVARLDPSASSFGATEISAGELLSGVILLAVPHMDDAALACGGTIAQLPDKERVHLVYATDGRRSPEPLLPGLDRRDVDLYPVRRAEAVDAMGSLGVPAANIHFLGLPDCRLRRHRRELATGLFERVRAVNPDLVLAPFRYDRHPDHLAVNRAVLHDLGGSPTPRVLEYFVYHQWRLLREGDVRAYLRPGLLRSVSIGDVSRAKRSALDKFASQTTKFFDWQQRPNLTDELLTEVSARPEFFLPYDPAMSGANVFERGTPWIRVAHRLEPFLKRHKDRAVAMAQRTWGRA
jgi:LmbE family N-acetylglucosaminyl deacetylase